MDAYAILAGGGVKGAALAGCLKAAKEMGIKFKGYGGTSAGSIIALLASAGYSPEELEPIVTEEIEFSAFLDDQGKLLERLKTLPHLLESKLKFPYRLARHWKLLKTLQRDFGLYEANNLTTFLFKKVRDKFQEFRTPEDVSFQALLKKTDCPLKIVASDLGRRRPLTYSAENWPSESVFNAVRASMSYPFVFKPCGDRRQQVDGGLCSNLPVFVFQEERKRNRFPVVAFDLVLPPEEMPTEWTFGRFCGNMFSTALESADYLLRRSVESIYYIPVKVTGVDTLDFNLTRDQRAELFRCGHSDATTRLHEVLPHWSQPADTIKALQALHIEDRLAKSVLRAFVEEVEQNTPAKNCRANVWLPTPHGTRIIAYQYRMDGDPDLELELPLDAGRTGIVWKNPLRPVFSTIRPSDDATVGMTPGQRNQVRSDRDGFFCIAIFAPGRGVTSRSEPLGLLAIDTSTSLEDTKWTTEHKDFFVDCAKRWADILSKLLY